jgi:hypothetical protein
MAREHGHVATWHGDELKSGDGGNPPQALLARNTSFAYRRIAYLKHRSNPRASSWTRSATSWCYDALPDESASSVEAPRSSSSVSR